MPQDTFLRRIKLPCPCRECAPLGLERHRSTIQRHLSAEYLRGRLRDTSQLLPEYDDEHFENLEDFEEYLDTDAAQAERVRILNAQFARPQTQAEVYADHLGIVSEAEPEETAEKYAESAENHLIREVMESLEGSNDETSSVALDITPMARYRYQWEKRPLEAVMDIAISNFMCRMRAGASESSLEDYTRNFNLLLRVIGHALHKEIPSHWRAARHLSQLTGIHQQRYHCCPNSCCAYTGPHVDLEYCPYCKKERFSHEKLGSSGEVIRVPHATFDLTSLTKVFRLQYADPERSALMSRSTKSSSIGLVSDIWDAEHYQNLRQRGYFTDSRTLALALSTDGIQLFKIGSFSVWPIMVVNLNLPRNCRYEQENLVLLGVIPGPNEPKDMNSYMTPVVNELLELENGIECWQSKDASTGHGEFFTLKAHLLLLQGDSPGMSKMVNHTGHAGYMYCWFCKARGVHHRGIRCPLIPPVDLPLRDGRTTEQYNPFELPMRTPSEWRSSAQFVELGRLNRLREYEAHRKLTGIVGHSPFLLLATISPPISFVCDFMHIVLQNLEPLLFRCWSGDSFSKAKRSGSGSATKRRSKKAKSTAHTQPSESEDEQLTQTHVLAGDNGHDHVDNTLDLENVTCGSDSGMTAEDPNEEVLVGVSAHHSAAEQSIASAFQAGFCDSNPYHLDKQTWIDISRDISNSDKKYPSSLGPALKSLVSHHQRFTAGQRLVWFMVYGPVLLKDRLPDKFYTQYSSLIHALQGMIEPFHVARIPEFRRTIANFVLHFEMDYYQAQTSRLHLCRQQIHMLLHMTDSIAAFGPLDCYWQFPMERLAGIIKDKAKSRFFANRNISLASLFFQQFNQLRYVTTLRRTSSEFQDMFLAEHGSLSPYHLYQDVPAGYSGGLLGPHKSDKLSHADLALLADYIWRSQTLTTTSVRQAKSALHALTDPYDYVRSAGMLGQSTSRDSPYTFSVSSVRQRAARNKSMGSAQQDRDATWVLFYNISSAGGPFSKHLGQVQLFAFYDINNGIQIALIQTWLTSKDGKLCFKAKRGKLLFVDIRWIEQPVGLLTCQGREFVVGRRQALWDEELL